MQQIQIRGICTATMRISKERIPPPRDGDRTIRCKDRFPPGINRYRDMKDQVDDTKLAKYVKANGDPGS
jgi:hypothetical protein